MISKTPWIERKFHFDFPVTHFPFILERLRGLVPRIEEMVKGLSEYQLSNKPDGKWSIKENIGHLTDLEELHERRLSQYLAGEKDLAPADMSNKKTNEAHHNEKFIGGLLIDLREARESFLHKLEALDEEQLNRKAFHPRLQQNIRLVDMCFFIAEHDNHHLTTIRELM